MLTILIVLYFNTYSIEKCVREGGRVHTCDFMLRAVVMNVKCSKFVHSEKPAS
jgi:hypothetical protein